MALADASSGTLSHLSVIETCGNVQDPLVWMPVLQRSGSSLKELSIKLLFPHSLDSQSYPISLPQVRKLTLKSIFHFHCIDFLKLIQEAPHTEELSFRLFKHMPLSLFKNMLAWPHIQSLRLEYNAADCDCDFTRDHMHIIAVQCPQLQELHLHLPPCKISFICLIKLKLKHLTVKCVSLTNINLIEIALLNDHLEHLTFTKSSWLTDVSCVRFLEHLTHLSMECDRVTSESLSHLFAAPKFQLRQLYLYNADMSGAVVENLSHACNQLHVLHLHACFFQSDVDETLILEFNQLETLNMSNSKPPSIIYHVKEKLQSNPLWSVTFDYETDVILFATKHTFMHL